MEFEDIIEAKKKNFFSPCLTEEYPIWWGDSPRIIASFVESYDFSGKTIVPFCTSRGSGIGSSAKNLHGLAASDVTWLDGERLKSASSREDIVNWIGGLGLDVTAE